MFRYVKNTKRKQSGFTLIEMMAALAITAVLAGFGFSVASSLKHSRIDRTAKDITGFLRMARSEAMRKGAVVVVCPAEINSIGEVKGCLDVSDFKPKSWSRGMLAYFAPPGKTLNELYTGEAYEKAPATPISPSLVIGSLVFDRNIDVYGANVAAQVESPSSYGLDTGEVILGYANSGLTMQPIIFNQKGETISTYIDPDGDDAVVPSAKPEKIPTFTSVYAFAVKAKSLKTDAQDWDTATKKTNLNCYKVVTNVMGYAEYRRTRNYPSKLTEATQYDALSEEKKMDALKYGDCSFETY